MVSRAIETAQRRVEARNFDIRKSVLEYDDVMNEQRRVIYQQRRQVLENADLRQTMIDMIGGQVNNAVERFASGLRLVEEWDIDGLLDYAYKHFLPSRRLKKEDIERGRFSPEDIREKLAAMAIEDYETKERYLGAEMTRSLERLVTLRVVDEKWMDHLDAMDQMRQGIGLRAIGQRDPLVEYKHEAFDMFSAMIADIQEEIIRVMYYAKLVEQPRERRNVVARHSSVAPLGADPNGQGPPREMAGAKRQPVVSEKIGRNDLCPCGSGLKYKRCCGKSV